MPAFSVHNFGIRQHQLGVGIFFERNVDNRQTFGNADLRSRQSNSMRRIHGFEHVLDQFLQGFVKYRNWSRGLLQHRISILNDRMNHSINQ